MGLESKIELPYQLRNEVSIETDSKISKYVGIFNSFRMKRGMIIGSVEMWRNDYELIKRNKHVLKFPFKIESKEETVDRYLGLKWMLKADYALLSVKGERATGEHSYRNRLFNEGFSKKVVLGEELMDRVFAPIDQQLVDIYKKFMDEKGTLDGTN